MGNCGSNSSQRSIVENFHILPDKKLIEFLEGSYCTVVENGEKKKDYAKLNDVVNMYEDTLLHYSIFHKKNELTLFLLEKGVDPTKMNKRKKSPLDIAKVKSDEKTLQTITEKAKLFENKKVENKN